MEIVEVSDVLAVVTDLFMPDGHGFHLVDMTRGAPPVIVMSSFTSDELLETAVDRGAIAVLRKPFRPDDLLAILESLN